VRVCRAGAVRASRGSRGRSTDRSGS
jgi:hypothetical protein